MDVSFLDDSAFLHKKVHATHPTAEAAKLPLADIGWTPVDHQQPSLDLAPL